jgi:hypothetical protein
MKIIGKIITRGKCSECEPNKEKRNWGRVVLILMNWRGKWWNSLKVVSDHFRQKVSNV